MAAAPDGAESRPIRTRGPRVDTVEALRLAVERAAATAPRAPAAAPPPRSDPYGHGAAASAAAAGVAAGAATVASAPLAAARRPHAEDLPPRLFDPRETEDWFQRLPPARQHEIRAYWQWDAERGARWTAQRRKGQRRAAVDTGLMLAGCWGLATVWSADSLLGFVSSLVLAFGIGAATGALLARFDGGRFRAAFGGLVAWLALTWSTGALGGATGSESLGLFFLLGMWLNAQLFAAWGLHREFRDD